MFRAAQEAIRNAGSHAAARHVSISVTQTNGTVSLRVTDDGRGFDESDQSARRAEGHMGLVMLRDLAEAAGASLRSRQHREPGRRSSWRCEIP